MKMSKIQTQIRNKIIYSFCTSYSSGTQVDGLPLALHLSRFLQYSKNKIQNSFEMHSTSKFFWIATQYAYRDDVLIDKIDTEYHSE